MIYKNIYNFILDFIYPPTCGMCEKIFNFNSSERYLCDECYSKFEFPNYNNSCSICGRETNGDSLCNICRSYKNGVITDDTNFYFERNFPLFIYKDLGRISIHKFKYGGDISLTKSYGKIFSNWYLENSNLLKDIDLIIPVPMYKKKERMRGFNQSSLIGKEFSKISSIPYNNNILIRKLNTSVQSKLSIQKRYKNLDKAFFVSKSNSKFIVGKNILLIDDIYTSGSTIVNCSKVLKKYGATTIYSLTLAITENKKLHNII